MAVGRGRREWARSRRPGRRRRRPATSATKRRAMKKKLRAEAKIARSINTLNVAMGPKSTVIGEAEDPEQRHGGVVHQVDADGRVQPVVDERVVAVQQDPRRLGEEPDLLGDVVASRGLKRCARSRGPRPTGWPGPTDPGRRRRPPAVTSHGRRAGARRGGVRWPASRAPSGVGTGAASRHERSGRRPHGSRPHRLRKVAVATCVTGAPSGVRRHRADRPGGRRRRD